MKNMNPKMIGEGWDAVSRREFLYGTGGVALSLVLSGRSADAGALPPATSLTMGRGGNPAATSATIGDALQLPFWGDAARWDQPQYY